MMDDAGARPIGDLQRILIVKLADLGDAVLATPAIHAVRRAHPTAGIDVLTTPIGAEVLALCPAIDRLITFPKSLLDRPAGILKPASALTVAHLSWRLRRGKYNAVVLLHHLTTSFGATKFRALAAATGAPIVAGLDNGRGSFLTHRAIDYGFGERGEWEYGVEVAATIGGRGRPESHILIPESARVRAETLLRSHDVSTPFIVMHPGVGQYSLARRWDIERFAAVARKLFVDRVSIVAVGTRQERAAALPLLSEPGVFDLMGETSIASLASLLSQSSLVIGADSGICHLAAAIGTRTISIFGPSNQQAWSPIGVSGAEASDQRSGTRNLILRSGIPCSPCFYVGFGLGRPNGCPLRTCLQQVTGDQVVDATRRLLAESRS